MDVTCVFLYLLPEGLEKVKPLLERCFARDGSTVSVGGRRSTFRVVSYMFRIPGWKSVGMREHAGGCCKIYLYDKMSLLKVEEEVFDFIEMVHP